MEPYFKEEKEVCLLKNQAIWRKMPRNLLINEILNYVYKEEEVLLTLLNRVEIVYFLGFYT